MASKVMCQLVWDDPSLSAVCAEGAWGLLRQMSPAGPITNVLTPLWHLPEVGPLNPWKRAERRRHGAQREWWMERHMCVRKKMARGEMRPCWTRQFLERGSKMPSSPAPASAIDGDLEASCMLGMLALVGIFTVAGPLSYFLVSMVTHPHWQAKVQKEIDEACKGQLPTLADTPNLPILRACIKETMRWKPNVPTGTFYEFTSHRSPNHADHELQVLPMKPKQMTFTTATSSPRVPASFLWTGTDSFLSHHDAHALCLYT